MYGQPISYSPYCPADSLIKTLCLPYIGSYRKLFEIGGRAYSLIKNTFISDKYDKILDIINELVDYTVYHFKREESIGFEPTPKS